MAKAQMSPLMNGKTFTVQLTDHERLANARGHMEAAVEELAKVKGFEPTIVEAANALTILHSILGEIEVRSLAIHLQDARNN
jgi:hypothetical protein